MTWLVEHAANALSKCEVGVARKGYARMKGKPCSHEIVEFGENATISIPNGRSGRRRRWKEHGEKGTSWDKYLELGKPSWARERVSEKLPQSVGPARIGDGTPKVWQKPGECLGRGVPHQGGERKALDAHRREEYLQARGLLGPRVHRGLPRLSVGIVGLISQRSLGGVVLARRRPSSRPPTDPPELASRGRRRTSSSRGRSRTRSRDGRNVYDWWNRGGSREGVPSLFRWSERSRSVVDAHPWGSRQLDLAPPQPKVSRIGRTSVDPRGREQGEATEHLRREDRTIGALWKADSHSTGQTARARAEADRRTRGVRVPAHYFLEPGREHRQSVGGQARAVASALGRVNPEGSSQQTSPHGCRHRRWNGCGWSG